MTFQYAAPHSSPQATSKKVLLVLDVVESVRLMEEDEGGAVQRWQQLVSHVVQHVLPPHEGRMVKSLGDGLMLEFHTAQQCVAAALTVLRYSQEVNAGLSSASRMQLRLGAHVAGFVTDEHDIYGADVNLAVRLTTVTKPGEFVVSSELREQLVEAVDGEIEDLGECFLKHISKPVRTYRVGPPREVVRTEDEHGAAHGDALQPTIAVLPFDVQSNEAQNVLLGEAIADELICALSRTAQLRVISRLSTSALKGRVDVVKDIRAQLRADYVLAGVCIDVGGKLVLFAELTDTKTGLVTWAERLRGNLHSLFAADNELIAQLSANVCSAMMRHQLQQARSQTLPTLESYALLLGAVTLMHRLSRADFERSRAMLDVLIDRLPREPLPRAWLARWHALRLSQGWSLDPRQDAMFARDCINRALDINPDCPLALTVDGIVHTYLQQDHALAAARYTRALEINPNEPFAWLHSGTLHAFRGEGEAAVAQTDIALSLSPLDPLKYYFDSLAATAAVSAGRYERAVELAQRSLRANRSHTSTLRTLTISQVQLGQLGAARESMRQMLKLEPAFTVRQYRVHSPTSQYAFGEICTNALLRAGAPA
jgi:adenylate cyclase